MAIASSHVGLGDVVDSFAAVIRDMEAWNLQRTADLYADVLDLVFPLGMYALASLRLPLATNRSRQVRRGKMVMWSA